MKRVLRVFLAMCVLLTMLAGCTSEANLNEAQAIEKLSAFVNNRVHVNNVQHMVDPSWVGTVSSTEELPPIDKYPLSVKGNGAIDVEIFSSTEKARHTGPDGKAADSLMEDVARRFNAAGLSVGGRSVSVSIRPIASGLALDYIKSRVYVPPGYSPANELWGEMIRSSGVKIEMVEKRLVGNVAGILMEPSTYKAYTEKYGEVTMAKGEEAVLNGDVILGHTDPNASSTGLNFLSRELLAFDSQNPFSAAVAQKFRQFQRLIPPTSPTTDYMAMVAAKGILNAVIMEAAAKSEYSTLSDWVFAPLGVRHDSPMYAMEGISSEQLEVLKMFVEYCKDAQELATSLGFNQYEDYRGEEIGFTGAELYEAQRFWKQNKDGGDPVISIFVMDVSGSMDYEGRLVASKKALLNAMQYINETSYVGLISYSATNKINIDVPVAQFDDNQQALFAGAIKDLRASGATATNSAVIAAMDMAVKAQEGIPNARIRIIVFTDGKTEGDTVKLGDITGIIKGLGIPVYGVFFMPESDVVQQDLRDLAAINEGYAISADLEDVAYKLKGLFAREL
jgi:Ca-activated chloride channel family protein